MKQENFSQNVDELMATVRNYILHTYYTSDSLMF